jgi:hypothetical protein
MRRFETSSLTWADIHAHLGRACRPRAAAGGRIRLERLYEKQRLFPSVGMAEISIAVLDGPPTAAAFDRQTPFSSEVPQSIKIRAHGSPRRGFLDTPPNRPV